MTSVSSNHALPGHSTWRWCFESRPYSIGSKMCDGHLEARQTVLTVRKERGQESGTKSCFSPHVPSIAGIPETSRSRPVTSEPAESSWYGYAHHDPDLDTNTGNCPVDAFFFCPSLTSGRSPLSRWLPSIFPLFLGAFFPKAKLSPGLGGLLQIHHFPPCPPSLFCS